MTRPFPHGVVVLALLLEVCAVCLPAADEGATRAAPLPRIAVREGRFVTLPAGEPFRPRGFNYIRLRPRVWHGTFSPKSYDGARAGKMLEDLARSGFNIVRVFIDPDPGEGIVEAAGAAGLSAPYLANWFDFLERARRQRVYVTAALCGLPPAKPYNDLVGRERKNWWHGNEMYLEDGWTRAKARYVADFAAAVKARDPGLLSTVFAYELDNETTLSADGAPFSRTTGAYSFAGQTYDLAKEEDLQRLADDAVARWADACVDAVRAVDPDAFVNINVYTFAAVGRTGPGALRHDKTKDKRFPPRPLALTRTKLAYLDVHFYPFNAGTLDRDLKSIEFEELKKACQARGLPLIMGEFGAFKNNFKKLEDAAAAMAAHWQRVKGLGFEGFLYWTYDTDEQAELWNAKSGQGEIYEALKAAVKD
jgi:hypothetical protein